MPDEDWSRPTLAIPGTGLNGKFIHREDIHNLVALFADPQETFVGRILGPGYRRQSAGLSNYSHSGDQGDTGQVLVEIDCQG